MYVIMPLLPLTICLLHIFAGCSVYQISRMSRIGLSFSLSNHYKRPHLGSPEPWLSTPELHHNHSHLTSIPSGVPSWVRSIPGVHRVTSRAPPSVRASRASTNVRASRAPPSVRASRASTNVRASRAPPSIRASKAPPQAAISPII